MKVSTTIEELRQCGLDEAAAAALHRQLAEIWPLADPVVRWSRIARDVLSPAVPFAAHRALFARNYAGAELPYPPPAWVPMPADIERANLARLLRDLNLTGVDELQAWAQADAGRFWGRMIKVLGIRFRHQPNAILDASAGVEQPRWLVGAKLNIAESCFQHAAAGVIAADEAGRERRADAGELHALAARFAAALRRRGIGPGDGVALVLPLSLEAVVAFLGTILAGAAAVGIAESFAPAEVQRRAEIGGVKLVVAQDGLLRAGKRLPLYEKLLAATLPPIVVTRGGGDFNISIRRGDQRWEEFLAADGDNAEPQAASPDDVTTVLFSSGTTAEPKAIPWTQATPIKCAADAILYQDVQPGDVLAWPTGMGWMMGPWLVYAGLVNGATIALFDGHAATPAFCKFVERTGVTVLGVVPSLVAAWQAGGIWNDADWSRVKLFSSTGECSQPEAMLALSSRAGYRPVIEYCGGTEIAGGYLSSTVLRPFAPACFNQPAFGLGLHLFDEDRRPTVTRGECFLSGAAIGHSTRLLNGGHHETYYAESPRGAAGETLRRHGDVLEALPGGYYRVLGRADDAMNLGGIKVSAVEIERVVNRHPAVAECAAVAMTDEGGGPSRLVIFAVSRGRAMDAEQLREELRELLRRQLNPLFQIAEVRWIDALPRTASNKVMRRTLRS